MPLVIALAVGGAVTIGLIFREGANGP